jgi:hypothetical protein
MDEFTEKVRGQLGCRTGDITFSRFVGGEGSLLPVAVDILMITSKEI